MPYILACVSLHGDRVVREVAARIEWFSEPLRFFPLYTTPRLFLLSGPLNSGEKGFSIYIRSSAASRIVPMPGSKA